MNYFYIFICLMATAIIWFLIKKLKEKPYTHLPTNLGLKQITPHNTIFAFDIHGVLFNHDIKKMARLILSAPQPLNLWWNLCKPNLWYDLTKLIRSGAVPEKCIMALAEKYKGLTRYIPLSITIANAQIPMKKTIELVQELKQQGYTLHIISNIGEIFFKDLQQKFPAIFKNFDAAYVASQADGYIGKPNQQIFKNYQQRYNHQNHAIIFIDNSLKNVKMALQEGMPSILFRSPEQLREELARLNVI